MLNGPRKPMARRPFSKKMAIHYLFAPFPGILPDPCRLADTGNNTGCTT